MSKSKAQGKKRASSSSSGKNRQTKSKDKKYLLEQKSKSILYQNMHSTYTKRLMLAL
jgi:hypothetical protein